nr:hypothetical protein Iba_chr04cCG11460 [Ipomoea batatas]GMC89073.1 hypothetical protein Iba_chr04eCG16040 [Ipomoea batatas]
MRIPREHPQEGNLAESGRRDAFFVLVKPGFLQGHNLPSRSLPRSVNFAVSSFSNFLQFLERFHRRHPCSDSFPAGVHGHRRRRILVLHSLSPVVSIRSELRCEFSLSHHSQRHYIVVGGWVFLLVNGYILNFKADGLRAYSVFP